MLGREPIAYVDDRELQVYAEATQVAVVEVDGARDEACGCS